MKSSLFACLVLTALVAVGLPTSTRAATAASSYDAEKLRADLVKDWERAKVYTKAYIDAMPADGINFKATPEIRSFAEQMLHLAQGTIGLSANGTGKEAIYAGRNLEKEEALKTKEALTKVVMESYDFAIEGVKAMNVAQFEETVKMANFNVSRIGWVMKAFEHQTHHRGQCTIYLRLKGVTPPGEMLF